MIKRLSLFLIIIFISASCGFTLIPKSDYDVDTTSPEVILVSWNANNFFDITRKTNSSFDQIANTSNSNVAEDPKIMVRFSENMYTDSLFQYGVSESVVIIEGEPSRSFLTGMKSPPLSDTNIGKILKVKVNMLSDTDKKNIILDFSSAENCVSEDDFKTKFCKLKKDTNYTLVVSMGVLNENGRELVLKKDDGTHKDDNFVMLFKTNATAPTVVSTQPSNNESGVCLNLQEVVVNFSTEMEKSSITSQSFFISRNNTPITDTTLAVDSGLKFATLKLNSDLDANSSYKINIKKEIMSSSRVHIEETTRTFTTASSASTQGPQFNGEPTAMPIGNTVVLEWKTDVDSLADIKYKKDSGVYKDFPYTNYTRNHSLVIPADDGPGVYTVSITPKDRCGNVSTPKIVNAEILNHPLISEVSTNSGLADFVELYNDGDGDLNLGSYDIVIKSKAGAEKSRVTIPATTLSSKSYATLTADANFSVDAGELIVLSSLNILKDSDNVFLEANNASVDSYTYKFVSSSGLNKTAQRIDVTIRNSEASNYCEASPTPGVVNSCQ